MKPNDDVESTIMYNKSPMSRLFRNVMILAVAAPSLLFAGPEETQAVRDTSTRESSRLTIGRFDLALDATLGGFLAPAEDRVGNFPITAEGWFWIEEDGHDHILLAHEVRNSGGHWALRVARSTQRITLELPGYTPDMVTSTSSMSVRKWHHVAAIMETDRIRLILDGNVVADAPVRSNRLPTQVSGFGIGCSVEERAGSPLRVDDVRITSGVREILAPPTGPLVRDDRTLSLWSFDESNASYLARWTPGGETNQRGLPYPHRVAEFEFETDPDWVDGRWQQTQKGLFFTHSTQIPGRQTSPKNMTLFTSLDGRFAAMFDLQRCGVMAVVEKPELRIDPARFGLLKKPSLLGNQWCYVSPDKLWRSPAESRPAISDVKFLGHRLREETPSQVHVITQSRIAESTIEDSVGDERWGKTEVMTRRLTCSQRPNPLHHTLAEIPTEESRQRSHRIGSWKMESWELGEKTYVIAVSSDDGELLRIGRDVVLALPVRNTPSVVNIVYGCETTVDFPAWLQVAVSRQPSTTSGPGFTGVEGEETEPITRLWGNPLVVPSQLAEESNDEPWVIDTLGIPFQNPFQALFFLSAIDFFADGTAAIASAHGDIWLVRGMDPTWREVSWQRFATGLYQPLGLKVVEGKIMVLGRNQLTRLHDRNGDGEADWYETFNDDLVTQGNDHAYAMRLEQGLDGSLYFVKSGDGPPHESSVLRVSPDGKQLDIYASGFRHPYGMGIGPQGELTVADNEGNWVPSSKIDLIEKQGFYGFLGAQPKASDGLHPRPPLCYIPKIADNSSGGQIWNTSDRWGPYQVGEMLHLSWGRCTLHAVLRQKIDGGEQGGTVRFPDLTFASGTGDAEFNPQDGQLYVVGLDGWQTGAIQDGCLQRVRYTGKPISMPDSLQVFENVIRISFTSPLDPQSASDPQNYSLAMWNYRWDSQYGSFHYSVRNPDQIGHDSLNVSRVDVEQTGRAVRLHVEDLTRADQLQVSTRLRNLAGKPLQFDIYSTVHQLQRATDSPER